MPDLPDIDELTKDLDPQARAVVKVLHGMLSSALQRLEAENAELKRMLFGQRSERRVMPPIQQETKRRSRNTESAEEKARREAESKKKRQAKKADRKTLPTVEDSIPVPDEQKSCDACGGDFRALGEGQISEQYEYVPAKLIRRRIVREKAVCRCGETIVTAPPPPQVVEGAEYGPGLHAHVVVSKCVDSLPLYRQAKQLTRAGAQVSRSTLGDLFHRSAELLTPLHDRLLEIVANSEHVNADETPLPVLAREKCRRGYVWTFVADKIVTYSYSPTRSGETPSRLLGETQGVLQVDGYTGYNSVTAPEQRARAACWAHARRYFFKALPTAPQAEEILDLIVDLYAVEYLAHEKGVCGSEAHRVLRDSESRRVVEKIEAWLDENEPVTPPKSPLGAAISYARGQWEALTLFLDDPKVDLDNNVSERALRTVALGRKNFLFAGNDGAAENLAVLQSLISTCAANGVNPQDYLADVLVRIQTHPHSRIDELLPQHWQPPDAAPTASVADPA
jgi:transposase